MQKEVLFVADVAVTLQLSAGAIYKLIHDGKLKATKRGKKWVILRENVITYARSIYNWLAYNSFIGIYSVCRNIKSG